MLRCLVHRGCILLLWRRALCGRHQRIVRLCLNIIWRLLTIISIPRGRVLLLHGHRLDLLILIVVTRWRSLGTVIACTSHGAHIRHMRVRARILIFVVPLLTEEKDQAQYEEGEYRNSANNSANDSAKRDRWFGSRRRRSGSRCRWARCRDDNGRANSCSNHAFIAGVVDGVVVDKYIIRCRSSCTPHDAVPANISVCRSCTVWGRVLVTVNLEKQENGQYST